MRKYSKRNKAILSKIFKEINVFDFSECGMGCNKSVFRHNGRTAFRIKLKVVNQELYDSSPFKTAELDSPLTGE